MNLPLASCLMPTRNRPEQAARAIAYFQRQTYPNKELVILDDGDAHLRGLALNAPGIRYLRHSRFPSLGAKRNAACEEARGDILLHWDDDDWCAPGRIATQVAALAGNIDLCGLDRVYFLDARRQLAWEYIYPPDASPWVYGATFAFRRDFWRRHPFAALDVGEDAQFVAEVDPRRLRALPDRSFFVAMIHDGNTSPKLTSTARWRPLALADIRTILGEDSAIHLDVRKSAAARARAKMRAATVAIPHGGIRRLPLLEATLPRLAAQEGVGEVVVVELGEAPTAASLAARHGARHVFASLCGPFERARALNLGVAAARHDYVLLIDGDILPPDGFVQRALAEIEARRLDFLIPYCSIFYLNEADSAEVRTGKTPPWRFRPTLAARSGHHVSGGVGLVRAGFYRACGGTPEAFKGWGGEDTAWFHIAATLGRAGCSADPAQNVWHLYHPNSGGHDATVASRNPHHAENRALLAQIRECRDPGVLAALIGGPPPSLALERAAPENDAALTVWVYWEGPKPRWIEACLQTIARHAPRLRVLDRAAFDALRREDRDIDIDRLMVAHRADFVRAYLLRHFGGIWVDADCLVMQSLAPLLDALRDLDFLAHRDRQGFYPNGFIGSRRGGAIIAAFYAEICARLRSGAPLHWISLGGEPLTRVLTTTSTPFLELPVERIQPVCWSQPSAFVEWGDEARHAAQIDREAICYMMSNTEMRKFAGEQVDARLFAEGTFFRFLLKESERRAGRADRLEPAPSVQTLFST